MFSAVVKVLGSAWTTRFTAFNSVVRGDYCRPPEKKDPIMFFTGGVLLASVASIMHWTWSPRWRPFLPLFILGATAPWEQFREVKPKYHHHHDTDWEPLIEYLSTSDISVLPHLSGVLDLETGLPIELSPTFKPNPTVA